MLTNLLKYEFKATGRVVLPIASGVLVLNIFTGILSHFIQNTSDRFPLAGLALVLLNLAALVSLLVVLAVCFFIEVQQFYRLLGDRGYLMLALPVQPWKHIAAKVICGTAWTVFGMLFSSVCCALLTGDFAFSVPHAEDFAIWAVMVLIVLALIAGALLHTYLALCFRRAIHPAAHAYQHRRLLRHRFCRADGGTGNCVFRCPLWIQIFQQYKFQQCIVHFQL